LEIDYVVGVGTTRALNVVAEATVVLGLLGELGLRRL